MILIDAEGQVLTDAVGKPVQTCVHLPFPLCAFESARANKIIALTVVLISYFANKPGMVDGWCSHKRSKFIMCIPF